MHAAREFLLSLGPLAELSAEERSAIRGLPSQLVTLRAGEVLVQDGDVARKCVLVLEGFVSTSKVGSEGKRQITCFFIPGDFPDLRTLHLKVMDSSITALTACRLAVLEHADLLALCRLHTGIAEALWKYTLVVSSIYQEWIVNVGSRAAVSRLAHLFCEMTLRLKAVGLARDNVCELPFTQTQLGEATGLSRIHLNRSLQDLRRRGLISVGYEQLIIHDWDGLSRVGQFDPSYLYLSRPDCRAA